MTRYSVAICLTLLAGCGGSLPETAAVRGRVTYEGQPVTKGLIVFQPASGRPAMAPIAPDGSYSLTTFREDDGALPGRHRITIKAVEVEVREIKTTDGQTALDAVGPAKWLVPQSYSNPATSPLEREVLPGKNEINFDLQ